MNRLIWNLCGGIGVALGLWAVNRETQHVAPVATPDVTVAVAPNELGDRAKEARSLNDSPRLIRDANVRPTAALLTVVQKAISAELQQKTGAGTYAPAREQPAGTHVLNYDDVFDDSGETALFIEVDGLADTDTLFAHVEQGKWPLTAEPEKTKEGGHRFKVLTSLIGSISDRGQASTLTLVRRKKDAKSDDPIEASDVYKLKVRIDTRGPRLDTLRVTNIQFSGGANPTATVTVELDFDSDDLNPNSARDAGNFYVQRIGDNGIYSDVAKPAQPVYDLKMPQTVKMTFSGLHRGNYRLTVPGAKSESNSKTRPLQDTAGNYAGGRGQTGETITKDFGLHPEAKRGTHVQFPEFLPTAPQPDYQRRINPGDRVETRVLRLYYFRDAHRVAQLINRTAESLNKQPVALAERRAEDARIDADKKTDERRMQEIEAVEAAQELRRMENEVRELEGNFGQFSNDAQRVTMQIADLEKQKGQGADEAEIDAKLAELRALERNLTGAKTSISKSIESRRTQLAGLRETAATQNRQAISSQAKEDRAREQQFRLEVASAGEDPDTFAAGIKNSVDPVAQCSVSVIGEGLLQVRGPRKGIDKIRTMVHQIDMPLGQIKVEIVTVQLNGERGDRMERPLGRVDAHLGLGRFLTAHSLMMLRQAIVAEAALIAQEADQMNEFDRHHQVHRDRKYLYSFFGRDFIDELYAMESEFLLTENKLLGLHSMDAVSLHQALFVLALAKNDVRLRILERFQEMIRCDLMQAEFDFRRTSELRPHKTGFHLPHTSRHHREDKVLRQVCLNNAQRYHFRNLRNFFAASSLLEADTMNPLQREFIKLAQIFKARLVTEMDLKQRVIERAMIEDDREFDLLAEEEATNSIRASVLQASRDIQRQRFAAAESLSETRSAAELAFAGVMATVNEALYKLDNETEQFRDEVRQYGRTPSAKNFEGIKSAAKALLIKSKTGELSIPPEFVDDKKFNELDAFKHPDETQPQGVETKATIVVADLNESLYDAYQAELAAQLNSLQQLKMAANAFLGEANPIGFDRGRYTVALSRLDREIEDFEKRGRHASTLSTIKRHRTAIHNQIVELMKTEARVETTQHFLKGTRRSLKHRKLLDFFIEEEEEKLIDLLEGTRAHIAQMDNYLKRMMTALEDDFNTQYYDPAFVRIRSAAREWDVSLGQVERTSILTNNRAFAKVTPQATMEFDLPKRKIAIVEAFDGAKAMLQDYGALANDPTFLAAAQMMGAGQPNGKMHKPYPGLPSAQDENQMGYSQPPAEGGSALQALVPDPSIYKFETGTGFEIRPVIQPDGHSVIYDFNYMYTTNVREPVKADEKHLGRIKRHFINTQVQTSSFDMRELSRYHVALKASRTSKGVPLFEDIPLVGMAFRPAPSDESSIQQNVILGRSVVYPTVFDLMGLRWAPSVVDLTHTSVRDSAHVVRGRHRTVRDSVDQFSRNRFDELIGIDKEGVFHRPDLYFRQQLPSPNHPGGHTHPFDPNHDPTGRQFHRDDPRPHNYQTPQYDQHGREIRQFQTTHGNPVGLNAPATNGAPGETYYLPEPTDVPHSRVNVILDDERSIRNR